jgi:hypothetical protein
MAVGRLAARRAEPRRTSGAGLPEVMQTGAKIFSCRNMRLQILAELLACKHEIFVDQAVLATYFYDRTDRPSQGIDAVPQHHACEAKGAAAIRQFDVPEMHQASVWTSIWGETR